MIDLPIPQLGSQRSYDKDSMNMQQIEPDWREALPGRSEPDVRMILRDLTDTSSTGPVLVVTY